MEGGLYKIIVYKLNINAFTYLFLQYCLILTVADGCSQYVSWDPIYPSTSPVLGLGYNIGLKMAH
jgi:hypothetical protein